MKLIKIEEEFVLAEDAMSFVYYKGENNTDLLRRKWENDVRMLLSDDSLRAIIFIEKTVKNIYGLDKEIRIDAKEQPCPDWQKYVLSLLVTKGLPPPRFIRLVVDHLYGVNTYFSIRRVTHESYAFSGKVIPIAS
jgi:hypothetical protein